ncbi:MAG: hypothetical protein CVU48_02785 [Candidatus Cloacimonetes bacterium HGW-Cloacimonetes-1]|jgi:uncharacterized membrane protein YkvA (DUF1232 family)|nr:MAG: hypothetical protein CVU48_02785 [Candidatus Cloacimonetes bacterium HGW-Cloacimonetes-1]
MTDDILNGREMPEHEQDEVKERILDLDAPKMKFYEDLRQKAKNWTNHKGGALGGKLGEYLFALPDLFILVCRLASDKRVPVKKKMVVAGIISYVLMPLDIIPDFIPVIGYLDDLVLIVMGLNIVLNDIEKKVLLDNWSGDGDLLDLMKKISATAEQFMNKNILQRIKNWVSK